jgi:DNA-binding Lrp family transcriptional regulator
MKTKAPPAYTPNWTPTLESTFEAIKSFCAENSVFPSLSQLADIQGTTETAIRSRVDTLEKQGLVEKENRSWSSYRISGKDPSELPSLNFAREPLGEKYRPVIRELETPAYADDFFLFDGRTLRWRQPDERPPGLLTIRDQIIRDCLTVLNPMITAFSLDEEETLTCLIEEMLFELKDDLFKEEATNGHKSKQLLLRTYRSKFGSVLKWARIRGIVPKSLALRKDDPHAI